MHVQTEMTKYFPCFLLSDVYMQILKVHMEEKEVECNYFCIGNIQAHLLCWEDIP